MDKVGHFVKYIDYKEYITLFFCYDTHHMRHCYLFALEVYPLEVEKVYDELLPHCTLVHRFWSALTPEELAEKIRPILESTEAITLISEKSVLLGPKQTPVSKLKPTPELIRLHMRLYTLLDGLGVEYTEPGWVGEGYTPHISEREYIQLKPGERHVSSAVYLIEVKVPGNTHKRFVRQRLALKQPASSTIT